MEKLGEGQLLGRFFASTRAKPREIAGWLGVRNEFNLAGCSARQRNRDMAIYYASHERA
jgi:hypothetical protein